MIKRMFCIKNTYEQGFKIKTIIFFGIKLKLKNYKKLYKQAKAEIEILNNSLDYLKNETPITSLKPAKGDLRRQQLALVDFAKDFFEFTRETNIRPFLIAGNLIGALRHKGFIPWDDDMDFGLIRKDYNAIKLFFKNKKLPVIYHNDNYSRWNEESECISIMNTLKKYPNQYILDVRPHLMKVIKGTSLDDFLFLDFFSFDYFSDNYTYDKYKEDYKNNLKAFKKLKQMKKINNYLEEKIIKDKNVVQKSNTIYWGFDNGMGILKNKEELMNYNVIFPLQKMKYEHVEFCVPNNPEEYLLYEFSGHYMDYPKHIGVSTHNKYLKICKNIK